MLVLLQRVALRGIWCQAGKQTVPARSERLSPKVKPTDTQWWQSGDCEGSTPGTHEALSSHIASFWVKLTAMLYAAYVVDAP